MINSYPKVWNLGHAAIADLFKDNVIIEEKIDGSQFSFGIIDGKLECRSHHQQIDLDNPGMFELAVETVRKLEPRLYSGWIYRCEYLSKPKHNTLAYDRVPNKYLIVFDINTGEESYVSYDKKAKEAGKLGLEVVPLLTPSCKFGSYDTFKTLLYTVSCLGGQTIEGIVIKNYHRFGRDGHVLMGKFVNEKFKEQNQKNWKTGSYKDILTLIAMDYKTEARWNKAIQHLQERGELTNEPKDIGPLRKEINKDILTECTDEIKEKLFKWAWKNIAKEITKGFPQYYKEKLAKEQFNDNNS